MQTHIRCPSCGARIEETEALADQVREELAVAMRAESEARLQQAVAAARQGVQETLDIQAALERQFPHDRIMPVPKGMRGADIVQRVVANTVGMYGEMRGLIGRSMLDIPALTLEAGLLEDRSGD